VNRKELASWLDISGRTVTRWVSERELPHSIGPNKELLFDKEVVQKWLDRGGLPKPKNRRKIVCKPKSLPKD